MKYLQLYSFLIIVLVSAASCTKWLDVKPEDKFTEKQIYSTEQGFNEVQNGLYISMSNTALYGRNLTLDKLDLFAQRYYGIVNSSSYYNFITLNYESSSVKNVIESIWDNLYILIGNANQFLSDMDTYKGVLSTEAEMQKKGETLAIRSMAYFDLLRLFGPVYSTDSTAASIPYYRILGNTVGDFLPANTVMQNILTDLDEAIQYLQNDKIVSQTGTANYNNFRFNLYAAKLLKARVLLWRGDKAGALATAKEVIAIGDAKFPWVTNAAVTGPTLLADKVFSTEIVMGVYNNNLTTIYNMLFNPAITEEAILSTGPNNYVATIFEDNSADYRYEYNWIFSSEGVPFRAFVKYRNAGYNTISLLRKSEAYYIAAETETDEAMALEYLNTVRRHRNLAVDVTDYTLLQDELTKEYEKEFYGEGQLWYYYKRKGMTTVRTPNTALHTVEIPFVKFVLPIPDSEIAPR